MQHVFHIQFLLCNLTTIPHSPHSPKTSLAFFNWALLLFSHCCHSDLFRLIFGWGNWLLLRPTLREWRVSLKVSHRTSLEVQQMRICLPMQGSWFDPWSRKIPHANKPMPHHHWAYSLEPMSHNYCTWMLQLLKPKRSKACALQREVTTMRSPHTATRVTPAHHN